MKPANYTSVCRGSVQIPVFHSPVLLPLAFIHCMISVCVLNQLYPNSCCVPAGVGGLGLASSDRGLGPASSDRRSATWSDTACSAGNHASSTADKRKVARHGGGAEEDLGSSRRAGEPAASVPSNKGGRCTSVPRRRKSTSHHQQCSISSASSSTAAGCIQAMQQNRKWKTGRSSGSELDKAHAAAAAAAAAAASAPRS